jgi:hypothetical protein
MTEYQIAFEAISPRSIEDLAQDFHDVCDGALSKREGAYYATVYMAAASGISAALSVVGTLEKIGLSICRIDPDLVDGPEIAQRLGVTRQAVQGWAKGYRGSGFPRPLGNAGGKRIWAWAQIVDWARRKRDFDEAPGLTMDEVAIVDAELARRRMRVTSQTAAVSTSLLTLSGGLKPTAGHFGTADYSPGRTVLTAQR